MNESESWNPKTGHHLRPSSWGHEPDRERTTGQEEPPPVYDSELPKWVLRNIVHGGKRFHLALRAPQYLALARFSHDLGTCVRSSINLTRSLKLCLKPFRRTRLGGCWSGAVQAIQKGSSLTAALRPAKDYLPPFFLPVVKAGEQSGRLDEALDFLDSHCRLLAEPASTLRKLWLFPVFIMMSGTVLKFALELSLGSFLDAFSLLWNDLISWLKLGIVIAIVMIPTIKVVVDQGRLMLPFVGRFEREIALHRFFRVLSLMYMVGDQRVEEMVRIAAQTVSNTAAKTDLLKAAKAIEQNQTIPEAFQQVGLLTSHENATIDVGDMSGTLEQAFETISNETGASMISKINMVQPILMRIVTTTVVLSIVMTALRLVFH